MIQIREDIAYWVGVIVVEGCKLYVRSREDGRDWMGQGT